MGGALAVRFTTCDQDAFPVPQGLPRIDDLREFTVMVRHKETGVLVTSPAPTLTYDAYGVYEVSGCAYLRVAIC